MRASEQEIPQELERIGGYGWSGSTSCSGSTRKLCLCWRNANKETRLKWLLWKKKRSQPSTSWARKLLLTSRSCKNRLLLTSRNCKNRLLLTSRKCRNWENRLLLTWKRCKSLLLKDTRNRNQSFCSRLKKPKLLQKRFRKNPDQFWKWLRKNQLLLTNKLRLLLPLTSRNRRKLLSLTSRNLWKRSRPTRRFRRPTRGPKKTATLEENEITFVNNHQICEWWILDLIFLVQNERSKSPGSFSGLRVFLEVHYFRLM